MNLRSTVVRLFVVALSMSCAATIRPNVTVTYEDAGGVTINRLAILPVTAGEGLEGFRRMTADSLYAASRQLRPGLTVLSATETLQILNEHGLAGKYANLLTTYDQTGILDQETLRELGHVLSVDHLLHVKVSYTASAAGNVEYQDLNVFAHLWDPEKGDLVWESSGGASVRAGEFEIKRSIPEILSVACSEVIAALPR